MEEVFIETDISSESEESIKEPEDIEITGETKSAEKLPSGDASMREK
jgi:hypothetical protein